MTMRGYEFYLVEVFNSISHSFAATLMRYRVEHDKIKFIHVPTSGHVITCLCTKAHLVHVFHWCLYNKHVNYMYSM